MAPVVKLGKRLPIMLFREIRQYSLLSVVFQHTLKGEHEYISKVAKTEKDACALVDAGFDFVCDFNEHKIFRKRKY